MKNNGVGLARSAGPSAKYESISARKAGTISTRLADAIRRAAFGKPSEWVSWSIIFAASIGFPRPESRGEFYRSRGLDRRGNRLFLVIATVGLARSHSNGLRPVVAPGFLTNP